MTLRPGKVKTAVLGDAFTHELAKMEEGRSSWRRAVIETDLLNREMQKLAESSVSARLAKELEALQSPVMSIAQQYQDLLRPSIAIESAYNAWQESERIQMEQMRKMFDPMLEIRESVLGSSSAQQLAKELTVGSYVRDYTQEITERFTGIGSVAQMLAQQAEDSRAQMRGLFDDLGVGSSIQGYLKDFEHVNRQWQVPNEVLGIVGSFKELQNQFGNVALPTIDWGSAAALATALGLDGIREQLALLGIESDGSIHEPDEKPERGLLSRKQSDAVALLSLLLSILFFLYQEISSKKDAAKTEAFEKQTMATLLAQTQQIQSLTVLIEKALIQAAQEPEERFVVRERPASVRLKPEHGSAEEGKLMPNEVVRVIDRDGKWVEVEYYHWLHKQYRTGWVLKKYLERVPVNYLSAKP